MFEYQFDIVAVQGNGLIKISFTNHKAILGLRILSTYWKKYPGSCSFVGDLHSTATTLREESRQTNVILQYKLLAAILSTVCSVIQ